MDINIVFCKTKRKFDKYIKINKIRGKTIIDIKNLLIENDINYDDYVDYFNIIIYTKILHALQKGKNIYYIPNFDNDEVNIMELFKLTDIIKDVNFNFNILMFHDEFKNDIAHNNIIFDNIDRFNITQIIKDY